MLSKQRDVIGIAICLVTAIGYAIALFYSRIHATLLTFSLWAIWFQVANWVGQRGWLVYLRAKEIHAEARRGGLRLHGTALWISRASDLMALVGVATYIAARVG
jgi:hypothetical protein